MKVLVIGATGYLGQKIARHVRAAGHDLVALVRPGSDVSSLDALGTRIVRGDLTDKVSVAAALPGIDAVISSAIGYTGRRPGDSLTSVDDQGNRNLGEALRDAGIKRFVFISVLTADKARSVAHFHQKYLAENHFQELGLPFVALRPGAFLDQQLERSKPMLDAGGGLPTLFNPGTRLSFVMSDDVARAAVAALTLPGIVGGRIDLSLAEPASFEQVAQALSRATGHPLAAVLVSGAGTGMEDFIDYVNGGHYVADPRLQMTFFGPARTLDDAIATWLENAR